MKSTAAINYPNPIPYFLLVFSLLISILSGAQCDQNLHADANSQISYTNRGNRCEGVYTSQVSATGIDLVGLTIGKLVYDLKRDEVITISSPFTNGKINIRASGIPIKTYYRMDASLSDTATLVWPLKDVIFPKRISANNIGLIGWKGKGNDQLFVPLRATPKINNSHNDENIWIVFRSATDVTEAKWRYAKIKNGRPEPLSQWTMCNRRSYSGGAPINISLPASINGTIYFEFYARDKRSGEWIPKNLRIIVEKP
jgi:hypothetical protein